MQLGHGKAGALESVYVSINGSWGHVKTVSKFSDAVVHIAGEELHEPQQPFYLRLVHYKDFSYSSSALDISSRPLSEISAPLV